jgi:hypothetical protein
VILSPAIIKISSEVSFCTGLARKAHQRKLAHPRPQESPQKPWNSNTKTESGSALGPFPERFSESRVQYLVDLFRTAFVHAESLKRPADPR